MPKTPSYKLNISNIDETTLTLHSVVMKPRHSTPLDLETASKNLRIDISVVTDDKAQGEVSEAMPEVFKNIVHYLLTDYFVFAHRTGLYNRQLKLWEALATVSEVRIVQLQQGMFKKFELPIWDFSMLDAKGKTLLLVRLVQDVAHPDIDVASEKGCKALLTSTVQRAERLKFESPGFSGVFLFCTEPAAELMRASLNSVTAADDPIGKYEAKLLSLPDVALNLASYDSSGEIFSLLHPSLARASK